MILELSLNDIDEILNVERKAFIPALQATEESIRTRLTKGHIYLGVKDQEKLVGTMGLRFANFTPDFTDFLNKNPTFYEYANKENDVNANAIFIYNLGIIPEYRNCSNAKKLIRSVFELAKQKGMKFLVGDSRIPSYNGSSENKPYENIEKNPLVHDAIESYFRTGILPPREIIRKDPVAGFYLTIFPKSKVLGITNPNFCGGDNPSGGCNSIGYTPVD